MAVMSIRIDDKKRKNLKILASIQGKSMGGIVSDLIDEYIDANKDDLPSTKESMYMMQMSESSFEEWDNKEDEIYNDL
jgi:predicted transcriptional regulator